MTIPMPQRYIDAMIQQNDAQHLENLEDLEDAEQYVHQGNIPAVERAWYYFCKAESERLAARCEIMERYHLDSCPHAHKEKQSAVFARILQAIEEMKSKRPPPPDREIVQVQPVAVSLWQESEMTR